MAEAQLAGILRSVSGTIGNFNFRTTKNGAVIADLPTKHSLTAKRGESVTSPGARTRSR